jgi:helix-turn-helix protein
MTESFGARLRAERERQGIGLGAIALSTKINIALFEALERDDASRWPSGIFRRAFMRAYAREIGLDPESTVREFLKRFPDPTDDSHATAPSGDAADASADSSSDEASGLRLTLADEPRSFIGARRLIGWSPRVAAAVIDVAVVIGAAAAVFAIGGRFWTPFTIALVCYYVGGVAVLGDAPGVWLIGRARKTVTTDLRPAPMAATPAVESVAGADNLRQFQPRRKVV